MDKEDEIKLIAYRIWESEGCPNGHEWEHWFIAQNIWEQQKKSAVKENANKVSSEDVSKPWKVK